MSFVLQRILLMPGVGDVFSVGCILLTCSCVWLLSSCIMVEPMAALVLHRSSTIACWYEFAPLLGSPGFLVHVGSRVIGFACR